MKLITMAPTSEDLHTILPEDPFEIFFSAKDLDNSCETYFYCACSPPMKTTIPEASSAFRRALGSMDNNNKGDYSLYQPDSDGSVDEEDNNSRTDNNKPKMTRSKASSSSPSSSRHNSASLSSDYSISPSSSISSSPSASPASSPRTSPQHSSSQSSPRPINPSTQSRRKGSSSKTSRKFLSVPPSSLPTYLSSSSSPCKTADSSDFDAHNTLAGVALRKGCTRKSASFGGYDTVKVDRQGYEKRVSWADERGSKHQLIHVRLIRPRLALSTSDGRSSTPGHSILKTPEN